MNQTQQQESTPMSIRTKARLTFGVLIGIGVFFTLLAAPSLPNGTPGKAFFEQFYPRLGLDLQGGAHLVYDADLSEVPAGEEGDALEGARDVIERRVNSLGVSEPIVQTTQQGTSNRIIVELAGVFDVNEAITLIGETPLLEFKELGSTVSEDEGSPDPQRISEVENFNADQEKLAKELIARINAGESFEDLAREYSQDQATAPSGGRLGFVTRGQFTKNFEDVIFDQLAVGEITQTPILTEFGYHIIRKDAEETSTEGELQVDSSHILLKTDSLTNDGGTEWVNTELSGKHLQRAQVVFDPSTNSPQVSLNFNGEGSGLFEEITRRNIGQPVGIFLDGQVISAPVVQTEIAGGEAIISGNFTLPEAKQLVQRLNAGALPIPVELLSQQTIGASLGQDSLVKSLNAAMIGLVLVIIFMIAYYRLPGILSVVALALYGVITIGLFESIPVTLTLAGIAGFILSIGMAVDANILIFERIKEELNDGESFKKAVEKGFTRAWPSIRDSNISSLITCVILYWFGSSIIRGFAVTLGVGIMVSMFSAITVTRTFLRLVVDGKLGQKHWLFGVKKKSDA